MLDLLQFPLVSIKVQLKNICKLTVIRSNKLIKSGITVTIDYG